MRLWSQPMPVRNLWGIHHRPNWASVLCFHPSSSLKPMQTGQWRLRWHGWHEHTDSWAAHHSQLERSQWWNELPLIKEGHYITMYVLTQHTICASSIDKCITFPFSRQWTPTAANYGTESIWDTRNTVFFYLRGSLGEVVPSSDGVMCQMSELAGSQPGLHRFKFPHNPFNRSKVADTDYHPE